MYFYVDRDDMSVILEIKVTPSSGRQAIEYDGTSEVIKCRLKSPPEGGKANEELRKFLGKLTGVGGAAISIIRGETSRKKLIKIDDLRITSKEQFLVLCHLEVQKKI